MSSDDATRKDGTPPAPSPDANGAVPRNGSGADTAFMAMVKKRQRQAGDGAQPQPAKPDGKKSGKK
ncbi:MAG: hypothetical protein JWQ07_1457 [Ramlibacter sp.]|nr:hypothetical protein [Ramlibacter sp.]